MEIPVRMIGRYAYLRLPAAVLAHYPLGTIMELEQAADHLILKPKRTPRAGWDAVFKEMHAAGDDALLLDDFFPEEPSDPWD